MFPKNSEQLWQYLKMKKEGGFLENLIFIKEIVFNVLSFK